MVQIMVEQYIVPVHMVDVVGVVYIHHIIKTIEQVIFIAVIGINGVGAITETIIQQLKYFGLTALLLCHGQVEDMLVYMVKDIMYGPIIWDIHTHLVV
jgi:hypothetical protein